MAERAFLHAGLAGFIRVKAMGLREGARMRGRHREARIVCRYLLMRYAFAALLVMLPGSAAAQTTPPASQEAATQVMTADHSGWRLDRLRQAIQADAQRSFEPDCSTTLVPDRAMIPVEFTGGGISEYAVAFGRVVCTATGGPGPWQGTGGVLVQFWAGDGGAPRLVLEQQMHGFSIIGNRLITYQHGARCPNGAGPDQCRITYQWNGDERRFEVIERVTLSSLVDRGQATDIQHRYEELSR